MPQYSQEEAASLLGQHLVKITERLDSLEAKPVRDKFQREYLKGRRLAKGAGFDTAQLEERMIERGITHHEDAMRLYPDYRSGNIYDAQSDEDFKKLIESGGRDEGVLRRLIGSALSEVRADDDY
jgi:hypothetical protein